MYAICEFCFLKHFQSVIINLPISVEVVSTPFKDQSELQFIFWGPQIEEESKKLKNIKNQAQTFCILDRTFCILDQQKT